MMETTIIKSDGLGNLKNIIPGKVEQEKDLVVDEDCLATLLAEYHTLIELEGETLEHHEFVQGEYCDFPTAVLQPGEINEFLQYSKKIASDELYVFGIGLFISRLIQNSYRGGHNNFELDQNGLPQINYLAAHLLGKEDDPINVEIKGDTGHSCGMESKHCNYLIEGDSKGDAGYDSKNCIFRTTSPITLSELRCAAFVWHTPTKNMIYRIHKNGKEELVADNQ